MFLLTPIILAGWLVVENCFLQIVSAKNINKFWYKEPQFLYKIACFQSYQMVCILPSYLYQTVEEPTWILRDEKEFCGTSVCPNFQHNGLVI